MCSHPGSAPMLARPCAPLMQPTLTNMQACPKQYNNIPTQHVRLPLHLNRHSSPNTGGLAGGGKFVTNTLNTLPKFEIQHSLFANLTQRFKYLMQLFTYLNSLRNYWTNANAHEVEKTPSHQLILHARGAFVHIMALNLSPRPLGRKQCLLEPPEPGYKINIMETYDFWPYAPHRRPILHKQREYMQCFADGGRLRPRHGLRAVSGNRAADANASRAPRGQTLEESIRKPKISGPTSLCPPTLAHPPQAT